MKTTVLSEAELSAGARHWWNGFTERGFPKPQSSSFSLSSIIAEMGKGILPDPLFTPSSMSSEEEIQPPSLCTFDVFTSKLTFGDSSVLMPFGAALSDNS